MGVESMYEKEALGELMGQKEIPESQEHQQKPAPIQMDQATFAQILQAMVQAQMAQMQQMQPPGPPPGGMPPPGQPQGAPPQPVDPRIAQALMAQGGM